ncbi:MAG: hypothetical protein QOG53_192 [Frankiales bacterium]|nr:hypothetical protein [Frankiales bacterium]
MSRTPHSVAARAVGLVAILAALMTALLVTGATSAYASSESSNLSAINSARASHGLKALKLSSSLSSVARSWSAKMASGACPGSDAICHNPNLTSQVHGWQKIGENVGVGPDVSSIQNAFMNSSHHRANILDPSYTMVGIGTVTGSDGRLYITQDFEKPMGGTTVSPPKVIKHTTTTHHATTSRPSTHSTSSAPAHRVATRPAVRPAAPRPTGTTWTAKLHVLTSRTGTASDPVNQAFTYHSALASLTH